MLLEVTGDVKSNCWQEAEDKLHSSLQIAIKRCDKATFDAFGNWQLSGEFGEFKLSINCLLADCFMAKGNFLGAELLLRAPLEGNQDMRDHYIKSMRLAVQPQLLHAQLQLDYFAQAKETSLWQCRDVFDPGCSSLEKGMICWVVDELLICANELVNAKMLSGAIEILDIWLAARSRITTLLPEEVRDDVQRRHQAVSRLMAAERPSLSSEPAPEGRVTTSSRYPRSLEKPTKHIFLQEKPQSSGH